ncbi:F-box/LRR-repeat protein 6 [Gouania willdenowi]|uniref:F-box domain-containing protein n=1 Tax=Gouania willdenowi TaxID=441366 RepID=A0A8C5H5G8_GOUWI|nr:F-box/LRR-repeat protein 6 [Gouania willdenowi]
MDGPEAQSSAQGERKEVKTSRKAALKRTAGTKPKRKKTPRLDYTVQQGEDMLLVISNPMPDYEGSAWAPKKKGGKKKAAATAKGKNKTENNMKKKVKPKVGNKALIKEEEKHLSVEVPLGSVGHRWGQSLPEEVLINIFHMVVAQDGAVPFLCRVGRVCRLWNAAASTPLLWRSVTVGHCWIAPGKNQLPKTEQKVKDTVEWLAQSRFSQLRHFSLCHWKQNVDFVLEVVSRFCPHLHSLKLSYCSGLTASAFLSLGLNSRSLQNLNLQNSEFQVDGLLEFLECHGGQIRQILFTHGLKNDKLMAAITRGFCPDLELLEVNTKLNSKDCELSICVQALQMVCPKLKTFRMLNVRPHHKTMRNAADPPPGFPLLEELCIATASHSYMTDRDLMDILHGSRRLRVLDVRGCARITPSGLAALPCPELECLFWGQYFSSHSSSLPKRGFNLVTEKWCQTLRELDIANQMFTEDDLEVAMSFLAQAPDVETLRSLNLSGTKITPSALRSVVGQLTALQYLNLSSCRYLPRGVKRLYRGQGDIRQLLDKLD